MPTIIYKNNNTFKNKNEYYLLRFNVRLRSSYLTVAIMERQENNIFKKVFIITLDFLSVLYCRNGIVKSDFPNSVYKSHGRGQNMTRRPLL